MSLLESPESSSPIVTRAVSAGLRGLRARNYDFPAWQKALLLALGLLPQGVARFVISRFQSFSGLPPASLDHFSLEDLVDARLSDYAPLSGRFPCILVGAAPGGAAASLSLSLRSPFLPQAFVITLRGGTYHGNVQEYLHRSLGSALRIAAEDPGLLTIQHYDPVHDGWLTRFVNHLRFKLLRLPDGYAAFIRSRLQPGGTVAWLQGGASWLRYRLGPRSVFQVGGWGGIPAREFLEGSPRLEEYSRRSGLEPPRWRLSGYPLEEGPESEWGSEPGMDDALETFCHREGFRFVRLVLPHPTDFSRLAFAAASRLLQKQERAPGGVLVEMFSQFDATAARQAGLLPLWLIFNTTDSLEFLQEMRPHFPPGKPVLFSPLSTFSLTPDLVPFALWEQALSGLDWVNVGARRSHYPSDARALVRWASSLHAWVKEHPAPLEGHLSIDELQELVAQLHVH